MTNVEKICIWVFVLTVLSITGIKWVYSQEALVEHSMAYQKNKAPQGDVAQLFSELGISNGAMTRLNPCMELEENALRYCTAGALKRLSKHDNQSAGSKLLSSTGDCALVAKQIYHTCTFKNFEKIYKHFLFKE